VELVYSVSNTQASATRLMASNFEFAALREAARYRAAIVEEFRPWLKGEVLEVGAGVGQMTAELNRLPEIKRLMAVEPNPAYCETMRSELRGPQIVQGTAADVPAGAGWDALVSINVLEHILEDETELERWAELLAARDGVLCLFVPARPEIYAEIDRDFGHHRRYTKSGLAAKLQRAGFDVLRLHYFGFIGYFAWWFNFRVMRQRTFSVTQVRLFDRYIFPVGRALEVNLMRPPLGQSLVAIAKSRLATRPAK
jgi:SAM-dependent methyltransferase